MTPADLFQQLLDLCVELTLLPDGGVRVKAPTGALTQDMLDAMRACKPALAVLVRPAHATPQAPLRQWVTSGWPDTATTPMGKALDAPKYHDVPQEPRTSLGWACPVKRCKPTGYSPSGRPLSLYYRPSGLCVACFARLPARKSTTKPSRAKARSKEKSRCRRLTRHSASLTCH
jgi:hypothetical protein